MPELEVRRHAPFADPERTKVEAEAVSLVENDPGSVLAAYRALPDSMNGRYVNSDLMKEVLPEYGKSPAHRSVFNVPVHNAAAVLANELFRRNVESPDQPGKNRVLFVTGIPGAGKTTAITENGIDLKAYRTVYEGQLSNFELAREKIQHCLDNGCEVQIYAFHRDPETALHHTFRRFNRIGRGASVGAMSRIQGGLPDSLEKIRDEFDERVCVEVIDLRTKDLSILPHDEGMKVLRSEGKTNDIKERLEREIEKCRRRGQISEPCYREAKGIGPHKLSRMQEIHGAFAEIGCGLAGRPLRADGPGREAVVKEESYLKAYRSAVKKVAASRVQGAKKTMARFHDALEKQNEKLVSLLKSRPNAIAALWRGAEWKRLYAEAQERFHVLERREHRFSRLLEDDDRMRSLAEAKFRRDAPPLMVVRDSLVSLRTERERDRKTRDWDRQKSLKRESPTKGLSR